MSSKATILNTIRANTPKDTIELPDTNIEHMQYANKEEKFSTMLQSVGGNAMWLEDESIDEFVKRQYPQMKIITSSLKELTCSTKDPEKIADPHELDDVELAIIKGDFAVAENGAVWVKNTQNRHRALYFLARQLLIIVPKEQIVDTMHEAYERVEFADAGYGLFISGPSKTADIEQSLVIGAHGPTDACVLFV